MNENLPRKDDLEKAIEEETNPRTKAWLSLLLALASRSDINTLDYGTGESSVHATLDGENARALAYLRDRRPKKGR
jgi:hypothetical protein